LPEDATVALDAGGGLTLSGPRKRIGLRQLTPGLRDALCLLAAPGARASRLADHVRTIEGPEALARWFYELRRLAAWRLLRLSVDAGGERLATLESTAPACVPQTTAAAPAKSYVLSRFAWTYRRGNNMALESPLSGARIVLHDQRAAAFVHALSRPGTAAEVGARVAGLPAEAAPPLLGLLLHAAMVCEVSEDGTSSEDADPALRCWEFHDLLFHSRSREGRHDAPVGGTYRHAGQLELPPALKPAVDAETIDLFRPDLEQLQRQDPPFARVQEQRRSARDYDAEPISDRQLGEFLYRVARVRERHEFDVETPAGQVRMDFATRPFPAGGGLYELEVYAAVHSCRGLPSGLYHYDPLGHRLCRRADRSAEVEQLLADAGLCAGIETENLQVVLILAARLPRIAWKYSSLAYALVLKHVGVVFQTMYLAATAMGLAPCALGGGNSDRFARAAGVNYYAETSVGEFLLGSGR
jgi:SagB-type dehydrogenase family enzyme